MKWPALLEVMLLGVLTQAWMMSTTAAAEEKLAPLDIAWLVVGPDGKPAAGIEVFMVVDGSEGHPQPLAGKTDANGGWSAQVTPRQHWEYLYIGLIANGGARGVGLAAACGD